MAQAGLGPRGRAISPIVRLTCCGTCGLSTSTKPDRDLVAAEQCSSFVRVRGTPDVLQQRRVIDVTCIGCANRARELDRHERRSGSFALLEAHPDIGNQGHARQ